MNKKRIINRFSNKSGFTLVEVLVAIAIFSVVISIAMGGFVMILRGQRQAASLVSAGNNVSFAMEQMAREIRTGYNFCRPGSNCDTTQLGCPPGCTFVTKNELDFLNANGSPVIYCLNGTIIERSVTANALCGDASFQPITSSNILVQRLSFTFFGNLSNDLWPPRIVISIGVSSKEAQLAGDSINLQTTVSARQLDS